MAYAERLLRKNKFNKIGSIYVMEHKAPLKTDEVTKILDNDGLRRPMLIEILKILNNGRNGNVPLSRLKGKEFQVESRIREYEGIYEFSGMQLRKTENYISKNATIEICGIAKTEGPMIFRVHYDLPVSLLGARYSLTPDCTDITKYTIVGVRPRIALKEGISIKLPGRRN